MQLVTGSAIGNLPIAHHQRTVRPVVDRRGRPRWQRGVALVELALVIVPLVMIVFTSIDLARYAKFQNRLSAAAREGAAIVQYYPGWIGPNCATAGNGGRSVRDRVAAYDDDLPTTAGYSVTVRKYGTTAAFAPGCLNGFKVNTFPTGSVNLVPGDKIEVVVKANFKPMSPLAKIWWGSSATFSKSAVVTLLGAAP